VTATGDQGDLDSRSVGPVEGFEIGGGYLELGVEKVPSMSIAMSRIGTSLL
jgi:hypothetical protein